MAWVALPYQDFSSSGNFNESVNQVDFNQSTVDLLADGGLPTPPTPRMRFRFAEQPFDYDFGNTPFGGPAAFVSLTALPGDQYALEPFVDLGGVSDYWPCTIVDIAGTIYAILDIVAERGSEQPINDWSFFSAFSDTLTTPMVTAVEYEVVASNFWEGFEFTEETT